MLDALHEDLNHIPKQQQAAAARPASSVEHDDDDDDNSGGDGDRSSDAELAQRVWKAHLERNRSIIVQLFHGLLKSEVVVILMG